MALLVERIPTLRDNYTYLLVCEKTGEAAVVDAPEAEPVQRRAGKLGARVTKILSTHHHPDHSAANPELAKRYDAPVYGHASDAKRIPGFTNGLEEGDSVSVGSEVARVLFIPAHTRGHIAYVFDDATRSPDGMPGLFAPYFSREPVVDTEGQDYVDPDARLVNATIYNWIHPLGDVVTSLLLLGERMAFRHEHDAVPWRMFRILVKDASGLYRWPDRPWLPLAFSLSATRR